MAIRLDPSGRRTVVRPTGTTFTLAELYAHVGPYSECLYFRTGHCLWVTADTLILPVNWLATRLARAEKKINRYTYIVGPALLTEPDEVEK